MTLEPTEIRRGPLRVGSPLPSCGGACPLAGRVRDCDECASHRILSGTLRCPGCETVYRIEDGIPNLLAAASAGIVTERRRTGARFGYLWGRAQPTAPLKAREPYHFEKLEQSLSLPAPSGLMLDAGCGDGIDLANVARRPGVEVIGVELSEGGMRTSFLRTEGLGTAHVVRADLRALPFATESFDFAYSYGVLHHISSLPDGAREIARILKQGCAAAVSLYEDFATRATAWRLLLRLVNPTRRLTTGLPPAMLYALCRLASPIVWLLFTVPAILLRRVPGVRSLAASLPYRHGRGPWSLTGDLFDRFSARRDSVADEA